MKPLACALPLLLALVLSTTAFAARLPQELAVNGGFEDGLDGYDAHVDATVVTDDPQAGPRCLRVDGAPDHNCFAQQSTAVLGGREYDLSVWARCADVPEGADCKVYCNAFRDKDLLASMAPLPRISGTHGWEQQTTRLRMPEGADRAAFILQLHQSTGTVWFDSLSVTPVGTPDEQARWEAQDAGQAAQVRQALELAAAAPEVAPGVRLQEDPTGIFLCNDRLALRLAGPQGAFGLQALVDLQTHRSFIVPGFDDDLFRVELRPRASYVYPATAALASATPAEGCTSHWEVRDGAVVLTLRWEGVLAEGVPAVDAEATITLRAGEMSRWHLKVTSRQGGAGIWLVDFPRFPALGASGDDAWRTDYLAIPMQQGWRWRDPRHTVNWGEGWADYPGGGKSMQFEAYCAGDAAGGGLYLGTEDGACYRKGSLCQERGDAFSYAQRHYPPDMGRAETYDMPYSSVVGMFPGDWWDAARIYRRWALQQVWSSAGPVRDRAMTPRWAKEMGLWLQGDLPGQQFSDMTAQVERITHFQREMGVPVAFHAYLWQHAEAHDQGYPYLTPPKPGAAEFTRALQAAGVRMIPYLNIYSGDGGDPRFAAEDLGKLAVRTTAGDLYGDPAGLVPMCVGTERWRQILSQEFRRTLDAMPVDGLYLDQLTGAAFMCFDATHGHPVGGGNYFAQGLRAICQEARAALAEKRPGATPGSTQGMTFGENTSECYNDLVDAQLPWAELTPDRNLPLYQAVYADYVLRFGLFIGRPDTWGDATGYYSKLAWTFVIGQQPGWLMLGILNELDAPAYAPLRAYLRELCACRLAALDFVQYGELLRPLDLGLKPRAVAWDDWSTPRPGALPPVLSNVWRAPDGRLGVALANWTAEAQALRVPVSEEWGLHAPLKWRIRQGGGWSESGAATPSGVTVNLPPRSFAVVEFSG
jgi:hypothetical protein